MRKNMKKLTVATVIGAMTVTEFFINIIIFATNL